MNPKYESKLYILPVMENVFIFGFAIDFSPDDEKALA